jgi:hypothetical protein
MKPRSIAVHELNQNGYYLKRNGANHDIFYNEETHSIIPLKRHDFNENDLRYIRKEINQNQKMQG